MKKGWKTAIIVLIVLVVIGGAVGGYFAWRHQTLYIGGDKALQTALDHAGLTAAQVYDIDTEFEKERSSAWYEVDFETMGTEYEYIIDAASGSILSSSAKPEHAGG